MMKFFRQKFSVEDKKRFQKRFNTVLNRGDFINGKEVDLLEKKLTSFFDRPFISCNSGTDALSIGLRSLGVGVKDEVIVPAFTFFAPIEAIYNVGARPILADINRYTYNIDPEDIESRITQNTKAILIVHLFGLSCDIESIQALCKKYKLLLIEDCAQSFGAQYRGNYTGTFGDIGCFSFFPTKNLGGFGDGGGITAKDNKIVSNFSMLKNHGQIKKYKHQVMGFNSRLDTLQAGLILDRLRIFKSELKRRCDKALKMQEQLSFDEDILYLPNGKGHTYNQFSILVRDRKKYLKKLEKNKIPYAIHYPTPVYRQKAFSDEYGSIKPLPNAEFVSKHIVSLPIFN